MAVEYGMLINLRRCIGCHACSVSCKVQNNLPEGSWWNYVYTLGGPDMDMPMGKHSEPKMGYRPTISAACNFCADLLKEGKKPFCVYNCPMEARAFGDLNDPDGPVNQAIRELRGKEYSIFKLPEIMKTKKNVYYASRE